MDDLKNRIIALFSETMLHKMQTMDSKTLNFWLNSINRGEKTLDDLKAFLLKSNDYFNAVKSVFMDVYYDRIGGNDYQNLFQTFVDTRLNKAPQGTGVTVGDIRNFIVGSDVFASKYAQVINSVYEVVKGFPPEEHTVTSFIEKFRNDDAYAVDNLRSDIQNDALQCEPSSANQIAIQEVDTSALTEEQRRELDALWNDKSRFLEFFIHASLPDVEAKPESANKNMPGYAQTEPIIRAFESVFGRNMTAQELALYQPFLCGTKTTQSEADLEAFLRQQKQKHVDTLTSVQELTANYLDEQLTEADFIKRHLHKAFEPGFVESFKSSILSSDEYKTKMCERVSKLYSSMYGETLDDDEVLYIFQKLQATQSDLMNEEMNGFLVDHKNDTDKITERIFNTYLETFEREPDAHEQHKYIQLYRSRASVEFELVDSMVKDDLVASLEYHDVIKDKIRKHYFEVKQCHILQSVTYKLLEDVLKELRRGFPLSHGVETHIRTAVQAL
jgi:hypothetical protein